MLAIATPLPGGRCSSFVVLYDPVLKECPWLKPPEESGDEVRLQAARPADAGWRKNFSELLRTRMPEFAEAIGGGDPESEAIQGAVINRHGARGESSRDAVGFARRDSPDEIRQKRFARRDSREESRAEAPH